VLTFANYGVRLASHSAFSALRVLYERGFEWIHARSVRGKALWEAEERAHGLTSYPGVQSGASACEMRCL
jgi:hypothetical protein